VVAKKGAERDTEHGGDKKEKENVEFSVPVIWCSKCNIPVIRLGPELDEVFERGEAYEDAVEKPIEEEEHKELVVVKGDTVVDPRTMMIHLEDTSPTHGTMMSSVWLDMCALITIPHCPLVSTHCHW